MNGKNRGAVSVVELLVAFALLAVLVSAIGKFASHVNRANQDLELTMLIRLELENMKEQIASWETEWVVKERIEAIPVAEELSHRFEKVFWSVEIDSAKINGWSDLPKPTQIRLALNAMNRGQMQVPAELYFWLPVSEQSADRVSSDRSSILQ
jgi:hypothetical protein